MISPSHIPTEFVKWLEPLMQVRDVARLNALLRELGYGFELPNPAEKVELPAIDAFEGAVMAAINDPVKLLELVPTVLDLPKVFKSIANKIQREERSLDINQFVIRLVDYLTYRYLQRHQSRTFGILQIVGLLEDASPFVKLHWDKLPSLLTNPPSLFTSTYQWGGDFDSDKFLSHMEVLLRSFLIPGGLYNQNSTVTNKFDGDEQNLKEIRIPLYQGGVWPGSFQEVDINLSPYTRAGMKGLALYPYLYGGVNLSEDLGHQWNFNLKGKAALEAGLGIKVLPPFSIEVIDDFFDKNPAVREGRVEMSFIKKSPNDTLQLLYGAAGNNRLGYKEISFSLLLENKQGSYHAAVEFDIEDFTLVINGKEGDGFIRKVLGNLEIESISDLGLGISSKEGFYFRGSSQLAFTIPLHKSLGPLLLDSVTVGVGLTDKNLEVLLGASFTVFLGPVAATVNRMGLTFPIGFGEGGNLGPVDIGADFLPPSGAALALHAPLISGLGYVDRENQRYAGILALKFAKFSITAIGLISTQDNGFSMLISINFTFRPYVQLSFGFQLGGVGGIVGINRGINTNYLRQGFRTNALDNLLFPDNFLQNPNAIIRDLEGAFPTVEGQFVIGPVVQLRWGNKMLTAELAVIIELPDPVRFVILGQIQLISPIKGPRAMDLKLDVLGYWDTGKKIVSIEALLFDSQINSIPVSGGAAFYLSYGDQPSFALSIGGFHPQYVPPEDFPEVPRLAIIIIDTATLKISCQAYVALTHDSFQVGMSLSLHGNFKVASVSGNLAFDALFYFSPFYFVASMQARVKIKVGRRTFASIGLDCELSGPKPWHVIGFARIKILFFSLKVPFDVAWGGGSRASLPAADAWQALQEALLGDEGKWSALLNGEENHEAHVSPEEEETEELRVHPAGNLEIRENVLPLNESLELYAYAPISGPNYFRLQKIEITVLLPGEQRGATHEIDAYRYVKGQFARSQYFEMTDSEKLGSPGFEPMDGGILLDNRLQVPQDGESDEVVHESVDIAYENILIDFDRKAQPGGIYQLPGRVLDYSARNSPVVSASHGVMTAFSSQFIAEPEPVSDELFYVVNTEDMSRLDHDANQGLHQYQASQMLQDHLSNHPKELGRYQVVSAFELDLS